ncbi:malic enzyme-like NAD(P)-binding protein, partial [Natronococcus sp.]|uniref:malic enzyme-like NAD(P)-binding protein n=1 Tax=Natronococcus sp. TaxID=35747 RepID=UPI003A4E1C85
MAERPIVFALSNPDPEILPELAHRTRKDLIMATGRSDYPNQVNNVLGFPYIFRGALDVRARTINEAMQIAAVHALSRLAREPVPREVLDAYSLEHLEFGPDYIIPTPLDPRLIDVVPPAVARAVRGALAKYEGSLLVFLPGRREIDQVNRALEGQVDEHTRICPLYGQLSPEAQDAAIRPPEAGQRKVVLATDIAETS